LPPLGGLELGAEPLLLNPPLLPPALLFIDGVVFVLELELLDLFELLVLKPPLLK
jgi:hypothetical protein